MLNRETYERLRAQLACRSITRPEDVAIKTVAGMYDMLEAAEEYGKTAGRSEMARDNAIALSKVLS